MPDAGVERRFIGTAVLVGRNASPEEVAASAQAPFVTGAALAVDGGGTIGGLADILVAKVTSSLMQVVW